MLFAGLKGSGYRGFGYERVIREVTELHRITSNRGTALPVLNPSPSHFAATSTGSARYRLGNSRANASTLGMSLIAMYGWFGCRVR
jgi:hypothetical protein